MKYLVDAQRVKKTKKTIKKEKKQVEKNRDFAKFYKKIRDRSRKNESSFTLSLFFENFENFTRFKRRDKKLKYNSSFFKNQRRNSNVDSLNFDKKKRFKVTNVNYFNFYLFINYNKNDVIILEKKTIYRDVYFFIESTKLIANLVKSKVIRIRLHCYLREKTQK